MTRFHVNCYIPGDIVAQVEEAAAAGPSEGELSERYTRTFDDGHVAEVWVAGGNPPRLVARLLSPDGTLVTEFTDREIDLAQDFEFRTGGNTYSLAILQTALGRLTEEQVVRYQETGGRRCPFCRSRELHHGLLRPDFREESPETAACCSVSCLNCDASWTAVYRIAGIEDVLPPGPDTQVILEEEEEADVGT